MAGTVFHLRNTLAEADSRFVVLDDYGQPLTGPVAVALERLAPAFARQFDEFRDEAVLSDALERAAHRIRRREARGGVINLEAYAWVTLVSIANSLRRRGQARLARRTTSEWSDAALNLATAVIGSPEQIERSILIRELLAHLTPRERVAYELRLEGLTSQEIAKRLGSTAGAVDVLVTRAHQRLRLLLNPVNSAKQGGLSRRQQSATTRRRKRGPLDMPGAVLSQATESARVLEL